MKNSLWYMAITSLLLLAACSPQRYTGGTAETDELYYSPGDRYISDQPTQYSDDEYGAEAPDDGVNGAEEYDYYNPDAAAGGGIPNFGRRWNGNMNGFNQPRFNVGVMSMWNRPGMNMGMGMGFNNPMPSNYFMGYSAFGSPMWGNGWNDPFCNQWDPYWGNSCFNGWNQPGGWNYPFAHNNQWGWGNPYAWNQPWGWNNPWNNPWGWNNGFGGTDLWGNNANMNYGPRTPVYQDTPAGGSYGTDQMYNPDSPRTNANDENVRPIQIGDRPLRDIERDLKGTETPDADYRPNRTRDNRRYEYYSPRGNNDNQRNTQQQPAQRQRNNGWNWDNFFDNNNNNNGTRQRQNSSPNRERTPTMNRSRGGGVSPASPSRNSGGRSGGGRSGGRR